MSKKTVKSLPGNSNPLLHGSVRSPPVSAATTREWLRVLPPLKRTDDCTPLASPRNFFNRCIYVSEDFSKVSRSLLFSCLSVLSSTNVSWCNERDLFLLSFNCD